MNAYKIGFSDTVNRERHVCSVEGELPAWLKGIYVQAGMGQYQVGSSRLQHWFDGYALLNKFHFQEGAVTFESRFVESEHYQLAQKSKNIVGAEFGTPSALPFWKKLFKLQQVLATDNTNINVILTHEQMIAMTETPLFNLIDTENLNTLGRFLYDDKLNFGLTLAHPVVAPDRKSALNVGVRLGRKNYYDIYRLDLIAHQRTVISSIPIKQPGYQHSFATTERYIILIDQPLRINPLRFLWNGLVAKKSYFKSYRWQPEEGTRFLIIEKSSGKLLKEHHVGSFFVFHTINAYEHGNTIIIDAPVYDDPGVVDSLYLDALATGITLPMIHTTRFFLPLDHTSVRQEVLNQDHWEFPRIADRCHSKPYRYFYAANSVKQNDFFNQIIKYDLEQHTTLTWQNDACYVGEPLFIANPAGTAEDDGVVCAILLDSQAQHSALLILRAQDLTEIARVQLPFILPFGLHTNFISTK